MSLYLECFYLPLKPGEVADDQGNNVVGVAVLHPNHLKNWEPYKKCNEQCDENFNSDDVNSCHSYTLCPDVLDSGVCVFKDRKYTGNQPLRETTNVIPKSCITMYRKCEEGIS